ncbi:MAG: aminotransferase class V-fold PLP-dependent enzyme [Myxococcota bacterium]
MDHHATTPVDARVLKAMLPYFTERFGNAASRSHAFGRQAREAVEVARAEVAALVGARAEDVVFTSGATEADNLALKGSARLVRERHGASRLVVPRTEHKAVVDSARRLEREGFALRWLEGRRDGRVDPAEVVAALDEGPPVALVSVMLCNNEVGAVNDVAAIGAACRERGVLFHCDATQGLGYVPFDVGDADLISLSAHKLYGPKGVGALVVPKRGGRRAAVVAELDGGGHERGMRSGTLPVPLIVGFGAAARLQADEGPAEAERLRALRDELAARLGRLEGVTVFGPDLGGARHPGNLNLAFEAVRSEALMLALDEAVAISSGAACSSASVEPSYVLRAMGVPREQAAGSLRFGLGRSNDRQQVDEVARAVEAAVGELRERSPEWRLRGETLDW